MSNKNVSLDVCLEEIHKEFVAVKEKDVKFIFESVFNQVKQKMGEQCNFFNKYSSQVLYAGSMYDGVKISKLDEFDMDIVIRLPINYEDGENGIIIENHEPGFVKLKIGKAFDNLYKQKEWENCHKILWEWRDDNQYLLQNKFRDWMQSVVKKALNSINSVVVVKSVAYTITFRAAGPAYTLNITNKAQNFNLDVDLVPVIRFMHPRWPTGYRTINDATVKEWFVVPKPNKAIQDVELQRRCWRLSFQNYEREMIKDFNQLKMGIRLLKKLRDVLEMKAIASYYIKTLFMWKMENINQKTYWRSKLSVIFRDMVQELYDAVNKGCIPYFWNQKHNLIHGVRPTLLKVYAEKLKSVLNSIDANHTEKVACSLLTKDEIETFKRSNFYLTHFMKLDVGQHLNLVHANSPQSNCALKKKNNQHSVSYETVKAKPLNSLNQTKIAEDLQSGPSIIENQLGAVVLDDSLAHNNEGHDKNLNHNEVANEARSCTIV